MFNFANRLHAEEDTRNNRYCLPGLRFRQSRHSFSRERRTSGVTFARSGVVAGRIRQRKWLANERRWIVRNSVIVLGLLVWGPAQGIGAETVILREDFPPGQRHSVQLRVNVTGELSVPVKEGEAPKKLELTGESRIEYVERILPDNPADGAARTIRIYSTMNFQRSVEGVKQASALRPEVRRLVLLRQGRTEVPFSPDGPLTWGEIDLVRTDTFVPALAGLLPNRGVEPGDKWKANADAVRELTDMDQIDKGELECVFDQRLNLNGRDVARISVSGQVEGVNEDGPSRQRIDGLLYFDIGAGAMVYFSFSGVHELLDAQGKPAGRITGRFTLTRQAGTRSAELSDERLRGVLTVPGEENTRLLYDNPELGLSLLYPRHWHVGEQGQEQLALDGGNGAGLLISVEPLNDVPTVERYQAEVKTYLSKYTQKTPRIGSPRRWEGIDRFRIEAELDQGPTVMDYFVLKQRNAGATVTANLPAQNPGLAIEDVEKIVKSIRVTTPEKIQK